MKKNILIALITTASSFALLLTSCSKDDTAAPNISITGGTSEEVSLNSGPWVDPGATANDAEDGVVTASSDASTTNPNTNLVGTYTITYTATDAAGNQGSAVRTVRVKNDAENFARTYAVSDVVQGTTFTYNQTITVDNTVNNKVHFDRFADYNNNTDIFGVKDSASQHLNIPLQSSGHDIGTSMGGTCDVVVHYFRTTSFTALTSGFVIDYVDSLAGSTPCSGTSTTGTAEYHF